MRIRIERIVVGALGLVAMQPALGAESAINESQLPEVVVTATKRSTNLVDTPIAISVVGADALEREGVRNARDLNGMVPNLQLGTGQDSGTVVSMRGITSTDFTEIGEGSVAIHQDGFYSPRSQGVLALMYDLDRVEVLRGPQGTLFGMNASGGVINIIPAAPSFSGTFGTVDATFGNYAHGEVRGMLNLPLGETFALRGSFMVDRADGMLHQEKDVTDVSYEANGIVADGIPDVDQRRNADVSKSDWYNNSDQWGARIVSLWEPTESFELTGTISHYEDNGAGDIDFVDCEQAAGTVNACTHDLRWVNINVPGEKHMTIDDYQLKLVGQVMERAAIEYRVSYQDQKRHQLADIDGGSHPNPEWSSIGEPQTPEAVLTGYYSIWDESWETRHSDYQTTTHELQFKSTGEGKLQYVTGLYYLHENKQIRYDMEMLNNKSYLVDPEQPLGFVPDGLPDTWVFDQSKRTTTSEAVFAQVDYRFTPKLNATLGYRYSWDEKADDHGMTYAFWEGSADWYNGEYTPTGIRAHQSNNLTADMGGGAPLGTVMPPSDPNTVTDKWSDGTYRVGLQYYPEEDHMWFASFATGYKMGGMYEMVDACNFGCMELLAYDPEYVKNWELGYKAKLLEGRLQFSAVAFFSDYEDMQNTGEKVVGTDEDPDSPTFGDPVLAWTTDNLTASRIKGLELEIDAIPWTNGRISGFAAWLDSEIVDGGTFEDGYACAEREIYGQPLCGDPRVADIRGNQLPFAPEFSLTVDLEQRFAVASNYVLTPRIGVHWQSKMWFDILNYDGAHLSQAQDAYTKLDLGLRLDSPGSRFHAELFCDNVTDEDTKNFFGFNRGYVKGSYDPPRTYGLRLGYSFQ
jgi:iron complex outermembrane recepter protein